MASKKKFDIFISHNSVDKPWVIKLKVALENQNIKVWLDKDEIRPGDLFAQALEDGIEVSKTVALIVSPESMESGWVKEEYYRALSLANAKKQPLRIIPIILRTAELPGFLSSRNWVDFRDEARFTDNVKILIWGITGQKENTKDTIVLPFVIAAMTKKQAKDLFEGKTKRIDGFTELRENLFQLISPDDLLNSYSDNADGWNFPFGGGEKISTTIWQTLEDLNVKIQEAKRAIVYSPKFETERFFSKDNKTAIELTKQLRRSGCVLVIDAISLFHEDIADKLINLQAESMDNIAIVIVSPLDSYAHPVMKIIEKEVRNHLQVAFLNFAQNMDRKYEFGVSNLLGLKRWFYATIPEMSDTRKAQIANRRLIRQHMGPPAGIEKIIFGSGGTE